MQGIAAHVELSTSEMLAVAPNTSVETLCELLIACEKAQHRYQWASGFLLRTLMDKPDTPKKPSAFAEWLATSAGMTLTQNEIKRRVTVYNFYSPFADAEVIALIESGGLRLAYDARRGIDRDKPEQARAVLQARIDGQGMAAATMPKRPHPKRSGRQVPGKGSPLEQALTAAKSFEGEDWVPLALVVDLLAARGDV